MGIKKKHVPGCSCCGCPSYTDNFNRTDSTSLGSDWSEVVGNWEIKTNQLYEPGTAGAITVYQNSVTSNFMTVGITINNEVVGGIYRLYLSWKDSSNHLVVKYERTSSTTGQLTLYSVIAGTTTELDTLTIAVTGYDPRGFSACIDNKIFIAAVDDDALCRVFADPVTITDGVYGGVGHGNIAETYFDDWSIAQSSNGTNGCPPCAYCHCGVVSQPKHLIATYEGTGLCDTLDGITCDLYLEQCGADWVWAGDISGTCLNLMDMELTCNGADVTTWLLTLNQKFLVASNGCLPTTAYPAYPDEGSTCDPLVLVFTFGPYDNIVQMCPDGCLPCGESGPADPPWTTTNYTITITEAP